MDKILSLPAGEKAKVETLNPMNRFNFSQEPVKSFILNINPFGLSEGA
jgi:hypothetical protein